MCISTNLERDPLVLLINSGEDSMKVGDLVKLSAYGSKRDHNWDAWGGWGIVTKVENHWTSKYPITTLWYKKDGRELRGICFHPRELKKYKPDKK
jgi:hypothetical protein